MSRLSPPPLTFLDDTEKEGPLIFSGKCLTEYFDKVKTEYLGAENDSCSRTSGTTVTNTPSEDVSASTYKLREMLFRADHECKVIKVGNSFCVVEKGHEAEDDDESSKNLLPKFETRFEGVEYYDPEFVDAEKDFLFLNDNLPNALRTIQVQDNSLSESINSSRQLLESSVDASEDQRSVESFFTKESMDADDALHMLTQKLLRADTCDYRVIEDENGCRVVFDVINDDVATSLSQGSLGQLEDNFEQHRLKNKSAFHEDSCSLTSSMVHDKCKDRNFEALESEYYNEAFFIEKLVSSDVSNVSPNSVAQYLNTSATKVVKLPPDREPTDSSKLIFVQNENHFKQRSITNTNIGEKFLVVDPSFTSYDKNCQGNGVKKNASCCIDVPLWLSTFMEKLTYNYQHQRKI